MLNHDKGEGIDERRRRILVEERREVLRHIGWPPIPDCTATATGEGGCHVLGWPVSGRGDLTGGRSMERGECWKLMREE